MHFVQAKRLLSAAGSMNIYRGCQHGCIYCDSRSDCYNMKHDFEDIEVKQNAPELLRSELRRKKTCSLWERGVCPTRICRLKPSWALQGGALKKYMNWDSARLC